MGLGSIAFHSTRYVTLSSLRQKRHYSWAGATYCRKHFSYWGSLALRQAFIRNLLLAYLTSFLVCSGEARPWGRKLDYWAIALSSISLTRCLFPQTRSSLTAGALAASTFNPLAVSTANAIAMEVPQSELSFTSLRANLIFHTLRIALKGCSLREFQDLSSDL